MDRRTRIKIAVNRLFLGKGKTIFESADHVNRSYNYLYRIANLNEDVPCPIEIAIPIMKFKNNFELLEAIAWECGFVVYKIPFAKIKKGDEQKMASDYQAATVHAVQALLKFVEEPNEARYDIVSNALKSVISESAGIKKYIDKKHSRQEELFQ